MNSTRLLMSSVLALHILMNCSAKSTTEGDQNTPIAISKTNSKEVDVKKTIDTAGKTIAERFSPPAGYERKSFDSLSFANYLRHLPLKPAGSLVKYYNGSVKQNASVYCAVIDKPIGTRDLHQCADAIIRLKSDYHYHREEFDKIHFNFTNGFHAAYSKWRMGNRIKVNNNSVHWINSGQKSDDYDTYWKYLEIVFSYAGTLSLSKELHSIDITEASTGNVFIQGGSPGHAIIIVDECFHPTTGKRLFLLAQSYMPAQETHILTNPTSETLSPWYDLDDKEVIQTPEWTFQKTDLKKF